MIPQAEIISWRNVAPWGGFDQVEHDLVLSRALCELYQNPLVSEGLIFRGGTALHKLFFEQAGRFSEDLDFVQAKAGPIGKTVDAIRECLDSWLGKPSWKQNQGRFTLNYRFQTEIEPIINRKVKIEINTREHHNLEPHLNKTFSVNNRWFQGQVNILTYSIEELLATKLRALYQRKKGRDLYDFWYATRQVPVLDIQKIIDIFHHYMKDENIQVSRAEFEKNLFLKQNNPVFNNDIKPLLSSEQVKQYQIEEAYKLIFRDFLSKLSGEPWKGIE
ncbi:MAG: nucleotidyl transferase AbiEii/AbiGii toxin family protein [Legionellales bacterium]|nr:nucleotidyl transferase AbiEii/AbiGii toxin family protein [Legionellales bacterium]